MAADAPVATCAEEGRRLFYDRVGRYFLDEPHKTFAVPKPCSVCGAMLTQGYNVSGGAQCIAQRSIAAKRVEQVGKFREPKTKKDGSPMAPNYYGMFNDARRAVLITPSRSVVIVNIKPVAPLPNSMTWSHEGNDLAFGALYGALLDGEFESPTLLVLFERRCDGPFVLTESPSSVVQCGGGTVTILDVSRLNALVGMAEALGPDFDRLVRLKGDMVMGSEDEALREEYLALLDRLPSRRQHPTVPHPDDGILATLRTVLKTRRLAKAA